MYPYQPYHRNGSTTRVGRLHIRGLGPNIMTCCECLVEAAGQDCHYGNLAELAGDFSQRMQTQLILWHFADGCDEVSHIETDSMASAEHR